jgi:hypothetical protein
MHASQGGAAAHLSSARASRLLPGPSAKAPVWKLPRATSTTQQPSSPPRSSRAMKGRLPPGEPSTWRGARGGAEGGRGRASGTGIGWTGERVCAELVLTSSHTSCGLKERQQVRRAASQQAGLLRAGAAQGLSAAPHSTQPPPQASCFPPSHLGDAAHCSPRPQHLHQAPAQDAAVRLPAEREGGRAGGGSAGAGGSSGGSPRSACAAPVRASPAAAQAALASRQRDLARGPRSGPAAPARTCSCRAAPQRVPQRSPAPAPWRPTGGTRPWCSRPAAAAARGGAVCPRERAGRAGTRPSRRGALARPTAAWAQVQSETPAPQKAAHLPHVGRLLSREV